MCLGAFRYDMGCQQLPASSMMALVDAIRIKEARYGGLSYVWLRQGEVRCGTTWAENSGSSLLRGELSVVSIRDATEAGQGPAW